MLYLCGMNYKSVATLLEDQLNLYREREKAFLEQQQQQVEQWQRQVEQMAAEIHSLKQTIESLEVALREKNGKVGTLTAQNRGLSKLLSHPCEKIRPAPAVAKPVVVSPKERGNNNAKRKSYFTLEEVIEDIYPDTPGFDREQACLIGSIDSIRYEYIPPKFIKHIYRLHKYMLDSIMYSPKAPLSPLLNSSYDSSFIAGMLQLRYIYSMPIERIIHYFTENGFELNKATAHGLVSKSAESMDRMGEVLRKVILQDTYLSMDETYYTVLVKEKNAQGKGTRKGYIWAALANTLGLIQYFYDEGSRCRKVLTDYIPDDYRGAIQSDGLADYQIIETADYPHAIRLGCFQHCKRRFFDLIEQSEDARLIVETINKLYQIKHSVMNQDWEAEKKLEYIQKEARPVLEDIKQELLRIVSAPDALPHSDLLVNAAKYTLGQFEPLSNCLLKPNYNLDNNAIERAMRYISLSRKNSLFAGSHQGARRSALIYSLACSCRLHGINTFEYFKDILNRLPLTNPNTPDEAFIELLPHKWIKPPNPT
jgi:hypothetical protein